MIRRGEGVMGRRAGEEDGLSGSGFGVSAGVIVTQDKRSGWMLVSGPDGSVHMPPCRVVGAKGRRQEARDPCSLWQARKQEPPAPSETAATHPRCTAGGQTGGSAQVRSTWVSAPNPGGEYLMTGLAGYPVRMLVQNKQHRNGYCTHPSLSRRGVGYRGVVIGDVELRPLAPIILGRRGRDLQQLAGWVLGSSSGMWHFWGAGFWGDMSLTPAGMAC